MLPACSDPFPSATLLAEYAAWVKILNESQGRAADYVLHGLAETARKHMLLPHARAELLRVFPQPSLVTDKPSLTHAKRLWARHEQVAWATLPRDMSDVFPPAACRQLRSGDIRAFTWVMGEQQFLSGAGAVPMFVLGVTGNRDDRACLLWCGGDIVELPAAAVHGMPAAERRAPSRGVPGRAPGAPPRAPSCA
jgi:hypothetical protein